MVYAAVGVSDSQKGDNWITDLSTKAFRRVLRKLLFDILEKDDDYIQIPMIILKSRYIDTLAKGFNVCFSFSVLSFKSQ